MTNIKMSSKIFNIFFLLLMLIGCASSSLVSRQLTIEKSWVRNTLVKDYIGPQTLHRMSPLLYKNFIIQGNGIDGLVAYDKATAIEKWRVLINEGVETSAEIYEEKLFAGGKDGQFYSIDPDNGRILWNYKTQGEILGTPYLYQNSVYFMSSSGTLYSLDAKSGKLKWTYSRKSSFIQSIRGGSRPVMGSHYLFFGTSDGYVIALDPKNGSLVWEKHLNKNKRFFDVDGSPIIDGSSFYITSFDDALYCLNQQDGKVLWKVDEGGFLPVVISENQIYYATSTSKIISLDKRSGKKLWEYKISTGVATEPVLYRGLLIFGESKGSLRLLDQTTGKEVGSYNTGRGIFSKPTLDLKNEMVYFISNEANLYALKISWTQMRKSWP